MSAQRETSSILVGSVATCQGCDWALTAPNALPTAARHHDATGHHVTVTITRLIHYGDPAAVNPDQLTIKAPAVKYTDEAIKRIDLSGSE